MAKLTAHAGFVIRTVLTIEIICAEMDYYMSASNDEYFNELSQMSGFVVNAKYPS